MTNPPKSHVDLLFEELKQQTEDLALKIIQKHGYHTPYTIQFKDLDQTEYEIFDIIIQPGNPVSIIINSQYAFACLLGLRKSYYYKQRLTQALERMERVHRTLRHMVPLRTALAWKMEAKSYTRIPNPDFIRRSILDPKKLEISYQVTVLDPITHTSVIVPGSDPRKILNEALERISQIVFDSDELQDMLENYKRMRKNKDIPQKESTIAIGGTDGEVRERKEY